MASLFKGRWAGSSPIGHSIKMASMFKGRWAGRSIVSFPVVAALLLLLMFHVVPTQQQQAAQALSSSCHVLSLIPFNTVPGGFNSGVWPVERVAKLGYTHLAAALLAVQHFNTRNGAIVPELEDLEDSGCNVTIDLSVINTEMEASSISRQVMDLVSSREVATNDDEENALCASVGGIDQTAAQAMQYFAIGLGAPNIHTAYFDETAVHWRRKDLQSLTLYTTVEYTARQMLQHLGDLGRSHLAVVYTPEPEGRHMAEFLRDAYGDYPDIEKVRTFSAAGPPGKPPSREILETMFNDIQETGFTTLILLDPRTSVIDKWSKYLDERNMLTENYLTVLMASTFPPSELELQYNDVDISPSLGQLLDGSMLFDHVEQSFYRSSITPPNETSQQQKQELSPFLESWRTVDQTFVEQLNELAPLQQGDPGYEFFDLDTFHDTQPSPRATFLYDGIILAALGRCKYLSNSYTKIDKHKTGQRRHAQLETKGAKKGPPQSPRIAPPTLQALLETEFSGATGNVRFVGERTKSRNPNDVPFGVYNIRLARVDPSTGRRSYQALLTHIKIPGDGDSDFFQPAFEGAQFISHGGRRDIDQAPPLLIADYNYLDSWVKALGLTMFGTTAALTVFCIIYLTVLREDNGIKTTQPFFMQLLCFGSLILASSIVTLSFDESSGWSDSSLDRACAATPWLFFTGQLLMFCSLFTKLYRLDRVLQFRRRQTITVSKVIWPLIVFLVITVSLLVAWTIVDPWQWERNVIAEVPPEMFGECKSDMFWEFAGPLIGILFFSECLALIFALKTADIPIALRETNSVLIAIAAQIQSWLLVPILAVLGTTNANATYLGRVFLIWIFSISSVAVVVLPKLFRVFKNRYFGLGDTDVNASSRSTVHISGLQSHSGSACALPGAAHSKEGSSDDEQIQLEKGGEKTSGEGTETEQSESKSHCRCTI